MSIALGVCALMLALFTALWAASIRLRDAGIADTWWGPAFLILSAATAAAGPGGGRAALVVTLVAVWSARLAISISMRNRGRGEDPRYRAMRTKDGGTFWWRSLYKVFWLQGVLAGVISAPLLVTATSPAPLGPIDIAGALIWTIGFLVEVTADEQLRRFRADPDRRGSVLRSGLWAWSRHPNYFGEAVLWLGYFVIAIPAGGWWTAFAPVAILYLLTRVSGVPMLEREMQKRHPGYEAYVREVPAFVPRPPRRPASTGEAA